MLPDELIAQTPLEKRSDSRLLVLRRSSGQIEHRRFIDVPDLLQASDLLVLNDTRVSGVRLTGRKESGGAVEVLLVKQLADVVYEAMVKPSKRLASGARVLVEGLPTLTIGERLTDTTRLVTFDDGEELERRLSTIGEVPLPPYIHERLDDRERYQTVYGAHRGSAAAPTAGLHFTEEILAQLSALGVDTARVTLHVGIDTFRPVQVDNLNLHKMHGEFCSVPQETASKIGGRNGRIIAVGTTTVRTLETLATGARRLTAGTAESKLFIRPGYRFKVVDGMFTNFHLPRTTMLMMISALAGRDNVMAAYRAAVAEQYRFLSFGDSMLILP